MKMRKSVVCLLLAGLMLLHACVGFLPEVRAESYMSNKTEIPVDLEVSGAEALCQTRDGYVWIAQYSGLTRYDSRDFVTYKSFSFDGKEYPVINVRALAAKENTLYVATSEQVYVHKDNHFEPLVMDAGVITDLVLDAQKDLLYISTQNNGGIIYDVAAGTKSIIPGTEGKMVRDIALDPAGTTFFYQTDEGIFDKDGKSILLNSRVLEIYAAESTLYMAEDSGVIHRYDIKTAAALGDLIVPDQVNKMLYSEAERILFVAC
ncbi:MAG: hypothetical protein J6Z79_00610, partial [Clostridia bacterium]|nr:hypothetical protein [Clostridia bacterium]